MEFLALLSIIFEILALLFSFYFKNSKIFFLTLSFLIARFSYFSSILQANLFISLFLPLVFVFLALRTNYALLSRKNLSVVFVLLLFLIASVFLPKNTNFIASILEFKLINLAFVKDEYTMFFIFFGFCLMILFLKTLKNHEFYLLIGFMSLIFIPFFYVKYFEFASFVFCFVLLYQAYKIAFFDPLTKLANEKNLKRYIKGKSSYTIALLHFSEFQYTKDSYIKLILKQIAKILKRFKARIFIVEKDFVIIFNDQNTALKHLAFLESTLKNTELKLENEIFKPEFKLVWKEKEGNLSQNLEHLRAKL